MVFRQVLLPWSPAYYAVYCAVIPSFLIKHKKKCMGHYVNGIFSSNVKADLGNTNLSS